MKESSRQPEGNLFLFHTEVCEVILKCAARSFKRSISESISS